MTTDLHVPPSGSRDEEMRMLAAHIHELRTRVAQLTKLLGENEKVPIGLPGRCPTDVRNGSTGRLARRRRK